MTRYFLFYDFFAKPIASLFYQSKQLHSYSEDSLGQLSSSPRVLLVRVHEGIEQVLVWQSDITRQNQMSCKTVNDRRRCNLRRRQCIVKVY